MGYKTILKTISLWLINAALGGLFRAIDSDGDGKLSKKELKEFLKLVNTSLKSCTK